jgi:serine/threonine-protein kinase
MQGEIAEGRVLAGKYRVERVLGRGGMGVVVAAHHLHLDEKVAIKFLLPEAVANAEVLGRFVREARAAVRIKSEHVARVSDVGTLEGGEPYMVMEYLEGSDLAEWLHQRGPLPVEQTVEFLLQASEAIAEAHALGIVHRDLKPANLFVVRRADGLLSIKVLDFGISKVTGPVGSADANMTRTTAVMGSPLYMPPEQMAASRNVDARADIWALGVILYELLAGRGPFSGETLPEVCMKIAIEPPPPIRNFRPDIPLEVELVILRCLEKDRERRYPNIAAFAQALVDFAPKRARSSVDRITRTIHAAGLSASALELAPPVDASSATQLATAGTGTAAPAASAGTGTAAPWGRTTSTPRRSSRKIAVVGGTVLLAALGALAFSLKRGLPLVGGPESSPGASSPAVSAVVPPAVSVVPVAVEPPATLTAPAEAVVPPPPSAGPVAGHAPIAKGAPIKKQAASAAPKHATNAAAPASPTPAIAAVATATSPAPLPAAPPAPKGNIFDDR